MAETGTTLTPTQKIEKARTTIDDLNRGQIDAEAFAPDAVWHSALFGEVRGRDAIVATLEKQRDAVDEFKQEPHAILADDEHTVVLANVTLRGGGYDVDAQQTMVSHTNDQGQITEIWTMLDAGTIRKLAR